MGFLSSSACVWFATRSPVVDTRGVAFDRRVIANDIERELRALGTPERAAGEKRYLKSDLDFLGVTMGQMRRVVKSFRKELGEMTRDDLVALVAELWSAPIFERRMSGVMLLKLYEPLLGPRDMAFLERLIRESKTWALVDPLAGDVTGHLVERFPEVPDVLDRWAADEDFWVRRSALLAFLVPLRGEARHFEHFTRYADAMLGEKEFFIRKAIGWVLRETGKRYPGLVAGWLAPRTARASGVTVREAVKYLEPAARESILEAYAARRPAAV